MSSTDQHETLEQLAHQSWLDRGQPIGSPEVDWSQAVGGHRPALLDASKQIISGQTNGQANLPSAADPPVLHDVVSAMAHLTTGKKLRSSAKGKAMPVPVISETPLEVPPATPTPAPPTPTKASARV